jgi:hypothetical protein
MRRFLVLGPAAAATAGVAAQQPPTAARKALFAPSFGMDVTWR